MTQKTENISAYNIVAIFPKMSSKTFNADLFNLCLSYISPELMEAAADTYEKVELRGDRKRLIKKMKMVHLLAYTTIHKNEVPKKVFTTEATVIWHIIKMLALISGADKPAIDGMWFEAIENVEENTNINEGVYLKFCNQVKYMKMFYDFITPASVRDHYIIEIETIDNEDQITMSYFTLPA